MIRCLQLLSAAGRGVLLRRGPAPPAPHRHVHCSECAAQCAARLDTEGRADGAEAAEPDGSLSYTEEEADTILHVLNTAPHSELAAIKLLRGKRAASIVQYREQHGPFLDLRSVVSVPHFQHKITVKVFDSILSPGERDAQKERRPEGRGRFIKPDVPTERLQATESIVSIVFGIKKMAWAHVGRSMTVYEWQQQEWFRFMKGPYFAHVYLEDVSAAVSQLPQADFYVLEKPGISMQNSSLFPVMLHMRTVEAMLYAMLSGQRPADGGHRVLSMARSSVGKHFDLMVGESRTSGLDIAKQLLTNSAAQEQPRVRFPPDSIFRYRNHLQPRGQNRNEELCDALLQAIAFYELAVF
ncbi:hypothetical protein XENTR_v10004582 [Xenopus tropicalis]|uniref:Transcription elongation factor, mitochondrial n=3 Tax=Xenopus tropicalis TaxID=8364 RepID=F6YUJ5_XENTR|nr:transcription elongation factor, mitochondrial [Xenopus tropicalis]KAE8577471.1 hypothetical protein XENTR_v10004582 [Xenopus tropicalis]|eukprot:XP_002943333.1 PREDICTED: transcription elongation factor, mitochondrial [Xenopus tropicalis]